MKKNKIIGITLVLTLVVTMLVGTSFYGPAYSLTMDVNPSIEIVSNKFLRIKRPFYIYLHIILIVQFIYIEKSIKF